MLTVLWEQVKMVRRNIAVASGKNEHDQCEDWDYNYLPIVDPAQNEWDEN